MYLSIFEKNDKWKTSGFCLNSFFLMQSHDIIQQEYLKEEGGLSSEALRMVGDLLNEQSLMYTALIEMIYDQTDISDSIK